MGKACRNASIWHCPYQMISFTKALGPAFSQSNKIHKSKSFSQAKKYVSAAVLSQSERLQVDYNALSEGSVKCRSSILLCIYQVQSDVSTKFLFATFCDVVAGKY